MDNTRLGPLRTLNADMHDDIQDDRLLKILGLKTISASEGEVSVSIQ